MMKNTCDMLLFFIGDPPGSSSGQVVGIVIGILSVIFVILVFGYIFGKDYWRRRHSYGWYNTITSPSSWCDSCCDCDFQSTSSWRSGATITHVATVSSTVSWIPFHVTL